MTAIPQNRILNFSLQTAGLLSVVGVLFYAIGRTETYAENANAIAVAMLLDLLIVVPLFLLWLNRKSSIGLIVMVPVVLVAIQVGKLVIPTAQQSLVVDLELWLYAGAAALALFAGLRLGWKIRDQFARNIRQNQFGNDCARCLESAIQANLGTGWISKSLATEAITIYYLLRPPIHMSKRELALEVRDGSRPFSYHQKSGASALLLVFILVIAIEMLGIHILIGLWSPLLAWLATLSSGYVGLMIVAQVRAMSCRPILIADDQLTIRNGMFHLATIPLEEIESVELTTSVNPNWPSPLNCCYPASHNVGLKLKNAHEAELLYGQHRRFQTALIFVDDRQAFESLVRSAISVETGAGDT